MISAAEITLLSGVLQTMTPLPLSSMPGRKVRQVVYIALAFRLKEKSDPLSMYLADILTVPANLAGIPAISVPCGKADGMPVGLQIMGRMFADERVVDVAYAYEQAVS